MPDGKGFPKYPGDLQTMSKMAAREKTHSLKHHTSNVGRISKQEPLHVTFKRLELVD